MVHVARKILDGRYGLLDGLEVVEGETTSKQKKRERECQSERHERQHAFRYLFGRSVVGKFENDLERPFRSFERTVMEGRFVRVGRK